MKKLGRREEIIRSRQVARRTALAVESHEIPMGASGTRAIDLRSPPYPVQCPTCYAPAFSLCREGLRILVIPHKWRVVRWIKRPDLRVIPL